MQHVGATVGRRTCIECPCCHCVSSAGGREQLDAQTFARWGARTWAATTAIMLWLPSCATASKQSAKGIPSPAPLHSSTALLPLPPLLYHPSFSPACAYSARHDQATACHCSGVDYVKVDSCNVDADDHALAIAEYSAKPVAGGTAVIHWPVP